MPADEITVWVDTAFNGSLVLPEAIVDKLQLPQQSIAEAILADGKQVELATFGCGVELPACEIPLLSQLASNTSKYGLLCTTLLEGRKLVIEYNAKSVFIE